MQALKFIDLFAGLGGFHLALKALGHDCVFACERDDDLAALYEKNFGIRPHCDIRALDLASVPAHDILCAGFPCQPFSKAGGQQGFQCPQWGDLIDYVVCILRLHKPQYFIIENVPNLVRHGQGQTWRSIIHRLRLAGYSVDDNHFSPHDSAFRRSASGHSLSVGTAVWKTFLGPRLTPTPICRYERFWTRTRPMRVC